MVSIVSLVVGTIVIEIFKPEIMDFKEKVRQNTGLEDKFNILPHPEVAER